MLLKAQILRIKFFSNFGINFQNKRVGLDLSWFWNALTHFLAFWLLLFGLKLFFFLNAKWFLKLNAKNKILTLFFCCLSILSFEIWKKDMKIEQSDVCDMLGWQKIISTSSLGIVIPCLPKIQNKLLIACQLWPLFKRATFCGRRENWLVHKINRTHHVLLRSSKFDSRRECPQRAWSIPHA